MARELEALVEREGCETLEEFAERELKQLRAQHDARLTALRGGQTNAAPWQPPPITQVESNPGKEPTQPDSLDARRTYVLPQVKKPAPWRKLMLLAAAVSIVLVSSWLLLGMRENEAASVPPVVLTPDSPPALPEIAAPEVPPEVVAPKPEVRPTKRAARAPAPKRKTRREARARPVKENSPQKKPENGLIKEW
jgi:hypothetical protein